MKVAVMQPYFMPYIGYFQMIKAVDKFVFYDDVNFIKKGWVNRNRILVQNSDYTFSVPLSKVSQNISINNTLINLETFEIWKEKFLQTLNFNYNKAPYFDKSMEIINEILDVKYNSISQLSINSIVVIANYLRIDTQFIISSEKYQNKDLDREERLIEISEIEHATDYINAAGGKDLYTKEAFRNKGIKLSFIKTLPISYKQFNNEFVPWLSIIDVLMFNSKAEIDLMLDQFELL